MTTRSKNDLVLLDSVISAQVAHYGHKYQIPEQFELLSFEQILKDYDLALDELESGWVDGGDDGGVDGFFVFLDGILLTSPADPKFTRREPRIDVHIITCKHKDSFKQEPINSLVSSARELFDLSIDETEIVSKFNEDVLRVREIFRKSYINIADKNPKLKVTYSYACRGDSAAVAENISARASLLRASTEELFDGISVNFFFVGASELLALYRVAKTFSLRLKFIEGTISRAKTNYVLLSRLDDFFHFVSDEHGRLRRYLFEANVRDYLGVSPINSDIRDTLSSDDTKDNFDFWWLNNGVTILCSGANVAGKEISLENIQIVNGLQTTESIHQYFSSITDTEDDRAVLVKVIVAQEDVVRDRIIKATNNQNPVELSSLRATDKIQRDIEHILLNKDWFYDRRKNFYKNQGKPADRIVSLSFMYTAVYALCLKNLPLASKPRARFMRDEVQYNKVFNSEWKIEVFLAVVEIMKSVEQAVRRFDFRGSQNPNVLRRQFNFIFAFAYAARQLGTTKYHPNQLVDVIGPEPTPEEMNAIWDLISETQEQYLLMNPSGAKTIRRPHRNAPFLETLKLEIDRRNTE